MKEFDYDDKVKQYRTKTTIDDSGCVVSVYIVFNEPIPIVDFNLERRISAFMPPFVGGVIRQQAPGK